MLQIKLGQYVTYKGNTYLVIDDRNEKVLIWNPSTKLQVLKSSVTLTNHKPAKVIDDYLVTAKGFIISLTSHKEMKWDDKRKELINKFINSNSEEFKALMSG